MKPSLKPERIRADQAAAILGINKRTVQAMALRGELPNTAKIGGLWTFDEAALRKYIDERIQQPIDRPPRSLRGSRASTDSTGLLSERRAQKALNEWRARLKQLVKDGT